MSARSIVMGVGLAVFWVLGVCVSHQGWSDDGKAVKEESPPATDNAEPPAKKTTKKSSPATSKRNAAGAKSKSMPANAEDKPADDAVAEKDAGKDKEFDADGRRVTLPKSNGEWKKLLTPQQYQVARLKGTERAFSGKYWNNHKDGIYRCVCCGEPLFSSETKFESGTGWPSFFAPLQDESIKLEEDRSLNTVRVEVQCKRCDAHLGHVFADGPAPTGNRFCMNSASLKFEEAVGEKQSKKNRKTPRPAAK